MTYTFKLSRRLAQAFAAAGAAALLAACVADTAPNGPTGPDSPSPVVISISITPAADSGPVGARLHFAAVPRDAQGRAVHGVAVTWTTADSSVLRVDASGEVTLLGAGEADVQAEVSGKVARARVKAHAPQTPAPPPPPARAGWHVAPAGTANADGTAARPWSLSHALSGAGGRIAAGDTVWLRGGTYAGVFRTAVAGAPGAPIVFRQYPGERATLDGGLRVDGHDVVFWGFEILQSNPLGHGTLPALETHAPRSKFINLVIHDAAQQGITFWDGAVDAEVYGCIVYNNGTHENKDHGVYAHNTSGTKRLVDNVFFNNLAYGIHVYATASNPAQRNVHVIGNVAFNNGSISTQWPERVNVLVGAEVSSEGMQVLDNLLFFSGTVGRNLWVGYTAASRDVEVRGNVVWGGASAFEMGDWSSATVRDNVIGGTAQIVDLRGSPQGHAWSGNRYYRSPLAPAWRFGGTPLLLSAWQLATGLGSSDLGQVSAPATPTIIVRPNQYEPGRAHVVVYNWPEQAAVSVALSGVLQPGQRFEVHNVQDVFGPPVASGTYAGGSISLPMTGSAPPPRLGRATPAPPRTGPRFDTFVVTAIP